MKTPKRPRDPNQLAKQIVDLATMDEDERAALQKKLESKKKGKATHSGKRGAAS